MRLYLDATSKKNIGYIPDWLKITYKEENKEYEITLDIQGDIDYDRNCLSCRCKGYLIPWTLYDCVSGDEIDLSELSEAEVDKMFPIKKIADIFTIGTEFRVGIYPADDSKKNLKLAEEDVLSECTGTCELYDGENEYEKRFTFEAEFNG